MIDNGAESAVDAVSSTADSLPGLLGTPAELRDAILEFFPPAEWDNAANIAYSESGFDAFAVRDTTDAIHPCGTSIGFTAGVEVFAERSCGYFQINTCNFPNWEWQRLYNARHNTGTAHLIWSERGWAAWYLSARRLGLI